MTESTSARTRVRKTAVRVVVLLFGIWSAGVLAFSPYASTAVRIPLALLYLAAFSIAFGRMRGVLSRTVVLLLFAVACLPMLAWLSLPRASNDRLWNADQERLPSAQIVGDRVTLANVRNFSYRSTSEFEPRWEQRSYDLSRLESLWFIVEPFSGFPGAAHTFLSFGFQDGEYLAVSAEIRKEQSESFSPWKGLYRNYELMYVFGDERDLVQLRTAHRKDTVYVYPVKASKELVRATFLDVIERANSLAVQPEFYNSITNTCTTNIAHHANRIQPGVVPFSWRMLLPGHSDELALELGLIDFEGTLEEARARFRVNERADRAMRAGDFSLQIRGN